MKKAEYARMAEQESTYWWHLGRLRIIGVYMGLAAQGKQDGKILNIGCGTGGTVDTLEQFGEVDNVDTSEDAVKFMKSSGHPRVTKITGAKLPFKDKSYDIVGAFDVLEHIDDHVGALKEWNRVLKDEGAIVLTVPAYQWLWSSHDVSLQHKRRYTTKSLIKAAKTAGLVPEKKSYAIIFSLPLFVGFRLASKLPGINAGGGTSYMVLPNWANQFFTNILYMEAKLHPYVSFWAGSSVVAILRKSL